MSSGPVTARRSSRGRWRRDRRQRPNSAVSARRCVRPPRSRGPGCARQSERGRPPACLAPSHGRALQPPTAPRTAQRRQGHQDRAPSGAKERSKSRRRRMPSGSSPCDGSSRTTSGDVRRPTPLAPCSPGRERRARQACGTARAPRSRRRRRSMRRRRRARSPWRRRTRRRRWRAGSSRPLAGARRRRRWRRRSTRRRLRGRAPADRSARARRRSA